MDFQYSLPTTITVKKGVRKETGLHLSKNSINNVLVITDQGIKNAGLMDEVLKSLDENQIMYESFEDVKQNPRDVDCNAAANQIKNKSIDGILAVGGGSVMDTAKAVSILHTNGGTVQDYIGWAKAKKEPLPVVCIPTTAGTGSEVTCWSVVTNTEERYKMIIGDNRVIPKHALLDAEVLTSLPASVAAGTGMDALTHAIEAYTCKVAHPISDALALHAIKLIRNNIYNAVYDHEITACENMLIGSMMAGMAFGSADTASVHSVAETVGGLYDIPHGVSCAIFLPYVFKFNLDADPAKHGEIGYALGVDPGKSVEEAAHEAVQIIFDLNSSLKIPMLRDMQGVDPKDFHQIAKQSEVHESNPSNAKEMDKDDFMKVLEEAYAYT